MSLSLRDRYDATLRSINQNSAAVVKLEAVNNAHKRAFSNEIRLARVAKDVSLRTLAMRARCSVGFLHDLENGRRWSDEIVERIVKELSK